MIGIVGPSSVVPRIELELARERLAEAGFGTRVHPQVLRRDRFFAGTDAERAAGLLEMAHDPAIDVLWCGRGGSGAIRTLEEVRRREASEGKPPSGKLLIGYSDATVIMEYVRRHWGWHTLHGPMLGLREFSVLKKSHLEALFALIRKEAVELPSLARRLKWIASPPRGSFEAELTGGNLTVWASVLGTPFEGDARGKALFFEDVGEAPYRIERMLSQLRMAGRFEGVKAIVLGTFERCEDSAPPVLARRPSDKALARVLQHPKPADLKPLRPVMKRDSIVRALFAELGERTGIPVAQGLPVGHGPEYPPLPLGAHYRWDTDGGMKLLSWGWLQSKR